MVASFEKRRDNVTKIVDSILETLRAGVANVSDDALIDMEETLREEIKARKAAVSPARKRLKQAKAEWESWLEQNKGELPVYQRLMEAEKNRKEAGHYRPLETAVETLVDERRRRS